MRKPRTTRPALLLSALVLIAGSVQSQEPAYPHGAGPTVLIDTAHHNLDPFEKNAARLEEDGYRVRELKQPFDREALVDVQITLIILPLASRNALPSPGPPTQAEVAAAWRRPTPSAFSEAEITILREWVGEGGALFLVLDHFPMSGAVQELGTAFGIEISNGFAFDGARLSEQDVAQVMAQGAHCTPQPSPQRPGLERLCSSGNLVFERAEGGVADDPITNGRTPGQRIESVGFFTGSSFRLPPEGRSLLTFGPSFVSLLPEVAWQFSDKTPREGIGGWSAGGVLRVERGRVAIFGEDGILAEPLAWAERHPELQNPQLFMNALHWLSGLLD